MNYFSTIEENMGHVPSYSEQTIGVCIPLHLSHKSDAVMDDQSMMYTDIVNTLLSTGGWMGGEGKPLLQGGGPLLQITRS